MNYEYELWVVNVDHDLWSWNDPYLIPIPIRVGVGISDLDLIQQLDHDQTRMIRIGSDQIRVVSIWVIIIIPIINFSIFYFSIELLAI